MIPTGSQPSQVPTGSQPSQAQSGSPAGVGPQAGSLAGVGPSTHPAVEPGDESGVGAGETLAAQPLFAVVKGEPTPEELAALAAVVLSVGSGEPAEPQQPSARHWIRRQQLQLAPKPGPGSWKRSRG
ncbi:hypothetical protein J2W14_000880 [Pseudarthrobacter oxydans]|uniref:acyl-CoA carboxylase subunit epsilon n=1 Tax=Pseudarthrobacter oxydans TaxID=1671 RepID=UPI00277E0B8C|nr:hypothetical protein [Pseudarthrobacter oxydans]